MKTLQNDSTIVTSLLALRDELEKKQANDSAAREILFKINSCLYDHYPIRGVALKGIHE